jgi:hypothetical protein
MRLASRFVTTLTIIAGLAVAGSAAAENVLRWVGAGGALTADPHAYDEGPTSARHRQV